jgi:protease I
MANELQGKRIAFLATDGVEQVELVTPWNVETGIVAGRTLASWPSLRTDIRNAGGRWVDEEVHSENGLVTSRMPDDLPAFSRKIVEVFSEGKHAR